MAEIPDSLPEGLGQDGVAETLPLLLAKFRNGLKTHMFTEEQINLLLQTFLTNMMQRTFVLHDQARLLAAKQQDES